MPYDNKKLDSVLKDFLTLKKLRRTGWQLRGIKEGESIADHCWGVVLLTHILSSELNIKLDRNKAVSIAIAHELGETRIGDIPYTTLKYFPNKRDMESAAISDILSPLSEKTKKEMVALFNEFEDAKTVEAKFVKAIDKLEMLITAAEYENSGYSGLKDFWSNESTFNSLKEFPELHDYALHLLEQREKRLKGEVQSC